MKFRPLHFVVIGLAALAVVILQLVSSSVNTTSSANTTDSTATTRNSSALGQMGGCVANESPPRGCFVTFFPVFPSCDEEKDESCSFHLHRNLAALTPLLYALAGVLESTPASWPVFILHLPAERGGAQRTAKWMHDGRMLDVMSDDVDSHDAVQSVRKGLANRRVRFEPIPTIPANGTYNIHIHQKIWFRPWWWKRWIRDGFEMLLAFEADTAFCAGGALEYGGIEGFGCELRRLGVTYIGAPWVRSVSPWCRYNHLCYCCCNSGLALWNVNVAANQQVLGRTFHLQKQNRGNVDIVTIIYNRRNGSSISADAALGTRVEMVSQAFSVESRWDGVSVPFGVHKVRGAL